MLQRANPPDLNLSLRLKRNPPRFATDEPVPIEVSLSSSASRIYYANWTALGPLGASKVMVEPKTGVVDPLLYVRGIGGSILGSSGYLSPVAVRETGDLTDWYRFEKPGRFQLSISTDGVVRVSETGNVRISLQSNPVEFEIYSRDAVSQEHELASVLRTIDQSKGPQVEEAAFHRLGLMQNRAAACEEVRRYVAGPTLAFNPYYDLLLESSELDEIIPKLESALVNTRLIPPPGIADLLSILRVRQRLGNPQPWLNDAMHKGFEDGLKERRELEEKLLGKYNQRLFETVNLRSGEARRTAEFEVLLNRDQLNASTALSPQTLNALRKDLLREGSELTPDQQSQLLTMLWSKLPHSELLRLIRHIALRNESGAGEAFEFWCKDWPEDCGDAILGKARESLAAVSLQTILAFPEAEHPEADRWLQEDLSDGSLASSSDAATPLAALIMRAGSRTLQSQINRLLDAMKKEGMANCQTKGYLFGYLLRVAPENAERRLQSLLADASAGGCGSEILREMNEAGAASSAVPVVTDALNSANITSAASAALFLGEHGSKAAKQALYARLWQLQEAWRGRTAQLRSPALPDSEQHGIAQLEASLISALVRAKNWILTDKERQSLEATCLTEECVQIVKGRTWLAL